MFFGFHIVINNRETLLFVLLLVFFTTSLFSRFTQNSTRPPLKLSNVERITNFQILVLFGCLLAISLVCSIGQTIWKGQYGNDAWYMDLNCKSPDSLRCTSNSTYFVSLVHISLFLCHFKFLNAGMCRGVFVLPQFKTVFRFTSEICGNVGIREFPVNEKSRDVHKCVVNECDWGKNGWISLRCCTFLFLSNVLFDFVVFFVVVFLTAPGNNHLKALAIREWPSLTNPLLKLCLC